MKINKILFVVTSHAELGNTGKKTGLWIEEFAAPYYKFRELAQALVNAGEQTCPYSKAIRGNVGVTINLI